MAQITETFAAGSEQVTVALTVGLVYKIQAETAPWSNQPDGSTVDQTAIIQAQLDAIPDGVPGAPNVIRVPAGMYFTQGDLVNNPRGKNGVLLFRDRHHLILEGPSVDDPAIFYTVAPAVPWSAEVNLNQHSLRRHFWFQACTDITVRPSIRVLGSNYTYADQLALGVPSFWEGGPDNGGTSQTRGYRAGWEFEHAFAFDGCDGVIFEGQCQNIWGDGLYLGQYDGVGCSNVTIGSASLVGTGRQGFAASHAVDVVGDGFAIGTESIRPRRAAIDLEPPSSSGVVERVELANFEVWMGNMTCIAAQGRGRVDHINIHDFRFRGVGGSRCNVGAADLTQRADWRLANGVWEEALGSPQAAIRFRHVDGVELDNLDVPVKSSQSRRALDFDDCGGALIVNNSRWGDALWVDYLNSPVPQLNGNVPELTLRNQ